MKRRVGNGTAIVTGAASGIGRALADELAKAGVQVVLADRQAELADHAASAIRGGGGVAYATELDVTDLTRFEEVVQVAFSQAGRLDYLFNNAGIGIGGEVCKYDAADWNDVIDVNLRGVAHGILAAYPLMIQQGFGHIVNTASMAGLAPAPLSVSYTASKYAVVGLSRALRIEARRYGVKVSVLCPGLVRTPIWDGGRYGRFKPGLDPADVAKRVERFLMPMEPAEFARRALRAVDRNRAVIVEPKVWRLLWYLDRFAPWLLETIQRRIVESTLRQNP